MADFQLPGWVVALAGIIAALVPAATLYFQRRDAASKEHENRETRRQRFEREAARAYDEYMDLRQTVTLALELIDEEPAQVKAILRQVLSHAMISDPTRFLDQIGGEK